MDDLEARIRRLEDRAAISETVINYGLAVDRKDWVAFARCFTDPVLTGYQDGEPTGSTRRSALVAMVAEALDGFGLTQHLSTNHVITVDPDDPDRATCTSAMYAQHELPGSPNGEFYLLRAIYTDFMRRTDEGWRIEGIDTENRWEQGNLTAVDEAIARTRAARG
ncbi:hypothetical protein FHX74_001045 [Friedmanniella endophytica]|uniref:SnoaL-like domain-containing protein n=1 Tax=Microlunatus kandeliicorticis TaxID=1759536 RepID=A0A7W3P526_9ACTN|nr:nuclear transport factor 2 family protein [Microlunatus kandeliicorticis]MBA8793440.1 hypothetical protein [Microlunatus kandeliicorticis]